MIDKRSHLYETPFQFLITEQGLKLIKREGPRSMASLWTRYQSADCCIEVGLDRSSVYVLLASPPMNDGCWIDFGTLVSYLTHGEIDRLYEHYNIVFDTQLPHDQRIVAQAEPLANVLKRYIDAIKALFASRPADDLCVELTAFARDRDRSHFEQYQQRATGA